MTSGMVMMGHRGVIRSGGNVRVEIGGTGASPVRGGRGKDTTGRGGRDGRSMHKVEMLRGGTVVISGRVMHKQIGRLVGAFVHRGVSRCWLGSLSKTLRIAFN